MCGFAVYTGGDKMLKLSIAHDYRRIKYRGPDNSHTTDFGEYGWMGFHRLKIIDISENGNQPLVHNHIYLVCNGEIYNYKDLQERYHSTYDFKSDSDCEVIIPLFLEKGIKQAARELDAEFVCVIYDAEQKKYFAARDPVGIRPLFYGYTARGEIMFASEMKALHATCDVIRPFPPGYVYSDGKFEQFTDIGHVDHYFPDDFDDIYRNINLLLTNAVLKRLQADVPVGFLLSGGLDSSLVCAIAARILKKPIRTFAVGINENPIDTRYAKVVADYLGADHTEVLFTKEDVFDSLSSLIYNLETFDITTIRASVGMFLICKYIVEKTDIKVLLTGEISDEIFGYKYTDFAPDAAAFQAEAQKRIREIFLYDVLRADRSISSNGLEARVPFGDIAFVNYVMGIPPEKKMNFTGIGKYILRKSFEEGYLPHDILYREKAAFSDAVGHSMVDHLKAFADGMYTEEDLKQAARRFKHVPPITKEALMYREIFEGHFPGRAEVIPAFWMPNKEWENCNVDDPSARVLPNYGKSGE